MHCTTKEESHSGGTVVEVYTTVTLLFSLMALQWATCLASVVVTVL